MPRPRQQSKIHKPPRIKGFIPVGFYGKKGDSIILHIEEYESIRLLDYENLSQVEAAEVMQISRPTLTRIYDRARKKMAKALLECLEIKIEGGEALYTSDWFSCAKCQCNFNRPETSDANCPICDSADMKNIEI